MPLRLSVALFTGAAATALAIAPLPAQLDDGTTFRWSGAVAAGHFIRVHNLNGDVRVERAESGTSVEVVAERRVRRGDPKVVKFEVRTRRDGDVVVCALFGDDMRCTDDGTRGSYHSNNWSHDNQIDVVMRVRVPDGVKAFARSTNGNVSVDGLSSEVDAATTNGDVFVRTTGGMVNASTTNGSVNATLGRIDGDQPMHFTSTNGSVTVYAPPSLSADLEMSTVNGGLTTEFPLTVSGRFMSRSVRGTLGQGGRSIVVRTTNGDVSLKRNGL